MINRKRKIFALSRALGPSPIFLVLCCAALAIFLCTDTCLARPKRLETAAPGDCKTCHGTEQVLPKNHEPTAQMTAGECGECHTRDSKSLRARLPLSHTHRLNAVACHDCHDSGGEFQALTTEQCLSCHGSYEEVAGKTTGLDPDPHNSPHYGKEQDCDLCHHQHDTSENFCAQCHEWKLTVP